MIPPFKLIDQSGAEYDIYYGGWAVSGSIEVIENLNPQVKKEGFLVFDVPPHNQYFLKVSGGYWSSEIALIRLSPKG